MSKCKKCEAEVCPHCGKVLPEKQETYPIPYPYVPIYQPYVPIYPQPYVPIYPQPYYPVNPWWGIYPPTQNEYWVDIQSTSSKDTFDGGGTWTY